MCLKLLIRIATIRLQRLPFNILGSYFKFPLNYDRLSEMATFMFCFSTFVEPNFLNFFFAVLTNLYLSHNSLHTMSVNQPYSNDKTELALSPLRFINLSYTHLARMELCHLLDLTRHLDHLVNYSN